MLRILITLAVVGTFGCAHHKYDVANPVAGPAPPRMTEARVSLAQSPDSTGVQQVSHQNAPLPMTAVVARVNGSPILAGQILDQYSVKLEEVRGSVSDEEFRRAQEMLIKRDLPNLIEQQLMVDAVKSKLTKEQLDSIEGQLDLFFDAEVQRKKKQFKVDSLVDLEAILQQQGMSLTTWRRMFGDQQLAGEYIRGKMGDDPPITRQDLLVEYRARLDTYAQPAQVKWQQLQISKSENGGEAGAISKINEALAELRDGKRFTDVVQRYSNGPLAKSGGHWDWTQPESIANADLRKSLAGLQVNQISRPLTTGNFVQVVKLTGRRQAGHTPFVEVQEDIRKEMVSRNREEAAKKIIAELKATAVIESIFDEASPLGGTS